MSELYVLIWRTVALFLDDGDLHSLAFTSHTCFDAVDSETIWRPFALQALDQNSRESICGRLSVNRSTYLSSQNKQKNLPSYFINQMWNKKNTTAKSGDEEQAGEREDAFDEDDQKELVSYYSFPSNDHDEEEEGENIHNNNSSKSSSYSFVMSSPEHYRNQKLLQSLLRSNQDRSGGEYKKFIKSQHSAGKYYSIQSITYISKGQLRCTPELFHLRDFVGKIDIKSKKLTSSSASSTSSSIVETVFGDYLDSLQDGDNDNCNNRTSSSSSSSSTRKLPDELRESILRPQNHPNDYYATSARKAKQQLNLLLDVLSLLPGEDDIFLFHCKSYRIYLALQIARAVPGSTDILLLLRAQEMKNSLVVDDENESGEEEEDEEEKQTKSNKKQKVHIKLKLASSSASNNNTNNTNSNKKKEKKKKSFIGKFFGSTFQCLPSFLQVFVTICASPSSNEFLDASVIEKYKQGIDALNDVVISSSSSSTKMQKPKSSSTERNPSIHSGSLSVTDEDAHTSEEVIERNLKNCDYFLSKKNPGRNRKVSSSMSFLFRSCVRVVEAARKSVAARERLVLLGGAENIYTIFIVYFLSVCVVFGIAVAETCTYFILPFLNDFLNGFGVDIRSFFVGMFHFSFMPLETITRFFIKLLNDSSSSSSTSSSSKNILGEYLLASLEWLNSSLKENIVNSTSSLYNQTHLKSLMEEGSWEKTSTLYRMIQFPKDFVLLENNTHSSSVASENGEGNVFSYTSPRFYIPLITISSCVLIGIICSLNRRAHWRKFMHWNVAAEKEDEEEDEENEGGRGGGGKKPKIAHHYSIQEAQLSSLRRRKQDDEQSEEEEGVEEEDRSSSSATAAAGTTTTTTKTSRKVKTTKKKKKATTKRTFFDFFVALALVTALLESIQLVLLAMLECCTYFHDGDTPQAFLSVWASNSSLFNATSDSFWWILLGDPNGGASPSSLSSQRPTLGRNLLGSFLHQAVGWFLLGTAHEVVDLFSNFDDLYPRTDSLREMCISAAKEVWLRKWRLLKGLGKWMGFGVACFALRFAMYQRGYRMMAALASTVAVRFVVQGISFIVSSLL